MMLSKHFDQQEFACKNGCGFMSPNPFLVQGLEALREKVGEPIIINDACRCPAHNAAVGGAPKSEHLSGSAADIYVASMDSRQLYAVASTIPIFKGFGVSEGKYIHVDVRDEPAKWCYDAKGREIPWWEPAPLSVGIHDEIKLGEKLS